MNKQDKIEFILKRLGDRLTKAYLETKSDSFIDHLYSAESLNDDIQMDERICQMF